jgi:hypothetical protein
MKMQPENFVSSLEIGPPALLSAKNAANSGKNRLSSRRAPCFQGLGGAAARRNAGV